MQPVNLRESVIQAELLRMLNDLYRARASRLAAVDGHIPEVIWWIIFLGGLIVTTFTYLFGFNDFRMHVVMTAALALSLSLVVVLIVALDWPFRGEVSVSPDAFIKAEQSWANLTFETTESASQSTQEKSHSGPQIASVPEQRF
jgi:ABC-type branched-subunit amino acid transport system permease subunit